MGALRPTWVRIPPSPPLSLQVLRRAGQVLPRCRRATARTTPWRSLHATKTRASSRPSVHVPEDVREHLGHTELWRSTLTADAREGRVRASLWEGHFGSLFSELRRSSHRMRREQIDSLLHGYLTARHPRYRSGSESLSLSLLGVAASSQAVTQGMYGPRLCALIRGSLPCGLTAYCKVFQRAPEQLLP